MAYDSYRYVGDTLGFKTDRKPVVHSSYSKSEYQKLSHETGSNTY
jgi:hypothetical protein